MDPLEDPLIIIEDLKIVVSGDPANLTKPCVTSMYTLSQYLYKKISNIEIG